MSVFSMRDISVFNMQEYSASNDLKKIKNHLYMLNEQLRYMFSNMSPDENFSQIALAQYQANEQQINENKAMIRDAQGNISILERTASSLMSQIQDAQGNISTLQQTAKSLTSQIKDAEGNISTLQQTATSLTSQIQDAQGNISTLQQTATSLTSQIQDAKGNISTLQQTATSLTSQIENAKGDISKVKQTADKIEWIVSSGTSASNFTLTSRMASLVSKTIDLSGFVTFTSLSEKGKTTINGGNITTGEIDAKLLEIGGQKIFESVNGKFRIYKDFMTYSVDSFSAGTLAVTTINPRTSSIKISGETTIDDDATINGRLTVSNITLKSGGSISGFKLSPSFSGSSLSTYSSITMSGGSVTNLTTTLGLVVGWMNNNLPKVISAVNGLISWAKSLTA